MTDNQLAAWDKELIQRYNISGPRYTSYPTALEFNQDITDSDYRDILSAISNDSSLSLYVHIPFCWHVCYYCACNKVVTRDYTRVNPYLEALEKEMAMVAASLSGQRVTQLHLGGGTPTFLNEQDRAHLMGLLRKYFRLEDDETNELSIEVDPRTVSAKEIAELRQLGFNRISLGVQDFNPIVQKAVNREQTYDEVRALVEEARRQQFVSISFDLIYGLPHQTVASFQETLAQVISLRPDRLSVFNYAHLPHRFKPQRRIHGEDLPSPDDKLKILQQTIETMQSEGYVYIGMDHFALPNDELAIAQREGVLHRNFQGYTTRKECEQIGLGVSSISALSGYYIQNNRELNDYYDSLNENKLPVWRGVTLSKDDEIRRAVILQLICNFELKVKTVEERFNIVFWDYFSSASDSLKQLHIDGLIELGVDDIRVTDKGRLFVRNICMQFDAYLAPFNQHMSYSKAL